jgi:hypothetical protein
VTDHPARWSTGFLAATGGVNLPQGLNLTRPLVRLEVTRERVLLTPRFGLRRLLGPWEIPRGAVQAVRPTSGRFRLPLSGVDALSGMEIVASGGRLWIFWCADPADVLEGLDALGYPVTTTPLTQV